MAARHTLSICFLMLLAIPLPALPDEIQKLTVADLAKRCAAEDPISHAFCNDLVTGVLRKLQTNGLFFCDCSVYRAPQQ